VVSLLKDLQYDRFITIEREISGDQQAKDITEALAWIRSLWNQ